MTKENFANVSKEDDLKWKMTSNERLLKWKMTSNGKLPQISKV
jgi:hypothetical protein